MTGFIQKVTARGPGPAHLPMPDGLTRCGRRLKGFGITHPEQVPTGQVCRECDRLAQANSRKAWRA